MEDRALAWCLFLAAATMRPSNGSAADDRIAEDARRADQLLHTYDTKFPPARRVSDRQRPRAGTGSPTERRRGGTR